MAKDFDEGNRHSPLKRFLGIVKEFGFEKNGFTIDDLKNYTGQSERTVWRYIKTLKELGCIDECESQLFEKKNKYRFRSSYVKSIYPITDNDIATLRNITKNKNFNSRHKDLIKKLLKAVSKDNIELTPEERKNLDLLMQKEGVALRPTPKLTLDEDNVVKIWEAIKTRHLIRCWYRGEKRERTFIPLGFLYGVQKVYLVVKDVKDGNKVKNLAVHKMSDVRVAFDEFEPQNFDLQAYAHESFGVYHGKSFDVKLRFDSSVREAVEKYVFHPTQQMFIQEDGSIIVTFRAKGEKEILWHVFTWGDKCTVLEPDDLRKEYVKMLKDVLKNHTK